jgi:hypothetical protein
MSRDYQAFLAREGRPLHLQEGHPVEYWDALRMGSVEVDGVIVSWDHFSLRLRDFRGGPTSHRSGYGSVRVR